MPPTILALDTAADLCSVALAVDGRIEERTEVVGQKHSERILPMVDRLLQESGLQLGDCDAIAFGAGPGAFTGLRIACGVAQGLAFGAGRPVVAVGNLAALAQAARSAAPGARTVLAAIDARMREIYWALYSFDDDDLTETSAPALDPAGAFAGICRRLAPEVVAGSALLAFPGLLAGLDLATVPGACASAGPIASLGARKFAAGQAAPAALAAPVYVRERVALTIDERRAGGGRR